MSQQTDQKITLQAGKTHMDIAADIWNEIEEIE